MTGSVRKSGRERKPTQNVNTDPYAGIDLSDEESVKRPDDDGDESSDLFVAPHEGDDPSEDELVNGDQDVDVDGEDDADGNDDFHADESCSTPRGPQRVKMEPDRPQVGKSKLAGRPVRLASSMLASRGLSDPRSKGSKEARRLYFFGPAEEDQKPALQNIYRWKGELVLPSRKPTISGAGGYHRSYYEKDSKRRLEMDEDWRWYDESGGKETFQQHQEVTELDEAFGAAYLPEDPTPLGVVLGPYGNQQKFDLPTLKAMDLNEPFDNAEGIDEEQRQSARRSGWLLNVGHRIQTLGWAPNQEGEYQYIALAGYPLQNAVGSEVPPAFTPQATPTKAAIQIWQFKKTPDGYFDQNVPPRLRQVICTDTGDIRFLKWCIAPRHYEAEDVSGKHLGLLAGIWGDGYMRILDITLPPLASPTQYLHLDSAAFLAKPPSAVFSSLCWVSAHAIIGSTSTGGMALFNLRGSITSQPATPVLASTLQPTYISSISTCYPSRPHILVSSSMAGFISMTDLSRVTTSSGINPMNTVMSTRSRISRQVIAWHDWSQMVISVDDNNCLQGLPLRRFYGNSSLARFGSGVLSLATSECHPFVAGAETSGAVITTNVMRKVLSSKETIVTAKWFEHTWRRTRLPRLDLGGSARPEGRYEDGMDVEMEEEGEFGQTDKGLVRIVEGFKAEPVPVSKQNDGDPLGIFTTIHEAPTAVTQVAWNPNLSCGGWIAAGTASGLLRVEDLGTP